MVSRRPNPNPKREQSIPVKVNTVPRLNPLARPPITKAELRPITPKQRATLKEKVQIRTPFKAMNLSVHEWSESKRRRLMWWLVGGGMTVIVIGWLAMLRWEMAGQSGQNIFTETARLFKTLRWPGTEKPSAAENEIRQLDQQVFPQFNQ